MISVEDYRRFVQPFIREQCRRIDYTLYHLDGVGALHHLPALLKSRNSTPSSGLPVSANLRADHRSGMTFTAVSLTEVRASWLAG